MLDYRQPIPPEQYGKFDVVFDTHGGLTVREESRLSKPGGVILDINSSFAKIVCIFLSRSRKFVMGKQDETTMREIVALAAQGKLKISIGRTVPLDGAIDLIQKMEGGERIKGKGLIVMNAQ
ncbi:UNVERIFIED_ORG: NADPH:quinone reductase-like Zn-dependent oxidoreductase [Rhizobium esperanzae]|uniref:Uncharacterized protein n=1 Tax=Rhizobium etli (strain CIAT 652) TaxID=491916 RepID=B3Q424_RHIE6|nr:zinc-binding dehydrogenase [Rhizobium phaseoli]ACE94828.1 hypothetical protein RHECIAT_PC0000754 [Rhizobium etli CIAT 652]MDH6645806.1 NADPH:quinone reductase-like Zn-dependent oxidoreductase [Rhizobium esperanzae]RUM22412.1 hypothetical protein EFD56_00475 [Rhizobium phaseoli]